MLPQLRQFFGSLPIPATKLIFPAIRIGGILLIGYLILRLLDSGLNRLRLIATADVLGGARVEQRTETLRQIMRSVSKVVLIVILVLTISPELGFDMRAVLAGAGILGLAVGFGAQSLVKDVISGFFILFEDQFGVGDVVKIGDFTGVVERMTLRATSLRNLEGQVHVVPNGNIQNVTVMTKDWARAVLDVTICHKEDLSKVTSVLQRIGNQLAQDWPDRVMEQPSVLGIEKLDASGVTLRCIVKTPAFKQPDVLREWRRRVKDEFDRAGIQVPDKGSQEVRLIQAQSAEKGR
jgi:small conductance mechanosensitive channel